jgi:hypothetical protein
VARNAGADEGAGFLALALIAVATTKDRNTAQRIPTAGPVPQRFSSLDVPPFPRLP